MIPFIEPYEPLPDPAQSDGDIVAYGFDLSVDRLLEAYSKGIFPWYDVDSPVLWWSPDPRMVLFPHKIRINKSLRNWLRKVKDYKVTRNRAFEEVINHCAHIPRKGQDGTWLHQEMIDAYTGLHRKGFAVSYEVWNDSGKLVGGLYGVDIGNGVFSGESMFSLETNASKLALIHLCRTAGDYGYKIIDAQEHTPYLESMGGELIPREVFLKYVRGEL